MAFCTECGADNTAGIKFCTSCGTPIGDAAQPVPVMAAAHSQPVPTMQSGNTRPASGSRYTVIGTGAYIGTMILFCIPVVGWIACIIMAFTSKNLNRRNFARAMLVFLIVGIVLSVALYFLFSWVAEAVMEYINEATGNMFGSFGSLGDLFDIIGGAGLGQ